MDIFGNFNQVRGCFYRHSLTVKGVSGVGGAKNINLILPAANLHIGTKNSPYVITAVDFSQKEKYSFVECFDDRVYTYGFGHDPKASFISVKFVAFLASPDGGFSNSVNLLADAYSKSRLSKAKSPAKLIIGGSTYWGFVVGFESSTVNAEYNIKEVVLLLAITSAQP